MKVLKTALIVLLFAPLAFVNTSCGGDDTPPVVNDTTEEEEEEILNNKFTLGFDTYLIDTRDGNVDCYYTAGSDEITISVFGFSKAQSGTGIVDGRGEFEIILEGSDAGTYSQGNGDKVTLEVSTGEGARKTDYSYDDNSNIVVNIQEWGEVGDTIRGTFSGTLKANLNSRDVKDGSFEVVRLADR
jgi:hypothetical protein